MRVRGTWRVKRFALICVSETRCDALACAVSSTRTKAAETDGMVRVTSVEF